MATQLKAPCACGARAGDGSEAGGVDPEIKHSIGTRLRRIEGQVRGLQKMIDEERYCADVLMQLSSVQEALRGVGRTLLQNHLKHCVTEAIRTRDSEQTDAMYEELMELMYRNAR
jgi:CsoR family transcriptional regulator, copper-sensing transcriptional repressor